MTSVKLSKKPLLKKKSFWISIAVIVAVLAAGGLKVLDTKNKVKGLFKLNKVLQEQNYYMAEFEYKMLGILYDLDKGEYLEAFSLLDKLYEQLSTKKGLIKLPDFKDKQEELEFYLDLQNPETGAFFDADYPWVVYHGPTENVLKNIDVISKQLGRPVKLHYPLKYLDNINTPEKAAAFLNDVSTVGWLVSMMPQTSFHFARDTLSLARDVENYDVNKYDMIIQESHLYEFSPEWRQAFLNWFYEFQDAETGLWGPKSSSGELLKKDLNNSSSILKTFVDKSGNSIHADFPLRYQDALFQSAIDEFDAAMPDEDDLDVIHEWNLKTPKTLRMITRYLWAGLSSENKLKSKQLFEEFVKVKFDQFYIAKDGAFSYYPNADAATLDGSAGSGGLLILKELGATSTEVQTKLWGAPETNITKSDVVETTDISPAIFNQLADIEGINSFRIYKGMPDYKDLNSNILAIAYFDKNIIPDVIDLTQKMKHWLEVTPQTMGNWVVKSDLKQRIDAFNLEDAPILGEGFSLENVNAEFKASEKLVVIGFDLLQIPKYKTTFLVLGS